LKRPWWTPAMTAQAVILAALLAYHYRTVLYGLVYHWKNNGDWSHGFVIPLFSLYYLYSRRDRLPLAFPERGSWHRIAGLLLVTFAFGAYMFSTIYQFEYPKRLSLILSIAGVVLVVCGWPVVRWGWFAVAFLVFAMPLPERLFVQLTMPLREIAANVSGAALSVIFPSMLTEVQGVVVHYWYEGRHGQLDVEQACSGIRLLIAMMALGVATAFVSDRPIWQRMVIILSCLPIAVFCNFIRVTITGMLHVKGQTDLATGFWHTLLGLGML